VPGRPAHACCWLFELHHDIRIVLPLMAATGRVPLLMERWLGLADAWIGWALILRRSSAVAAWSALAISAALEPDLPLVLCSAG